MALGMTSDFVRLLDINSANLHFAVSGRVETLTGAKTLWLQHTIFLIRSKILT